MNSVLPLINRGVISYWLETKPAEPSMLVVGSDGNISYQDIPVTQWGSISGSIEDQTDLTLVLGALDSAKVNKAGDTMTGQLNGTSAVFNSSVQGGSFNIPQNGGNWSQYTFTSGGLGRGALVFDPPRQAIGIRNDNYSFGGEYSAYVDGSGNFRLRNANVYNSSPVFTVSPAGIVTANEIELRNSTTATRAYLYGTYTDASNYRRLYLSSTTAGAFTLGVEGLGTGASGNTLTFAHSVSTVDSAGFISGGGNGGMGLGGGFYVRSAGSDVLRLFAGDGSGRLLSTSDFKYLASTHRFKNAADSADAPITAGAITASGSVAISNQASQLRIGTIGGSGPGVAIGSGSNGQIDFYPYNGQGNPVAAFWSTNAASPGLVFSSGRQIFFSSAATPDPNATDSSIKRVGTGLVQVQADNGFRIQNYAANAWAPLTCGDITTTGTLAIRNGNNATRLNLYGTYTDASNYRRFYLSSTTAGAFTLGVEGLGTGASGNTLTINNGLFVTANSGFVKIADTATSDIGVGGAVILSSNSQFGQGNWVRLKAHKDIAFDGNVDHNFLVQCFNSAFGGLRDHTFFHHYGYIGVNKTSSLSAMLDIVNRGASDVGARIRLAASATANAFEIQNSAGSVLSAITAAGNLSATGGTFNGELWSQNTLNFGSGTAGNGRINMTAQQYTPSNVAINMPWGSGQQSGIYGSAGLVGFASVGTSFFEVNSSGLRLASTRSIGLGGTIASPEVLVLSGGANVLEQRNGTNAQRFNLYGTYTDASNYRRLYLSSTTAGAFTLGVEGLGTGASGNTLTVANATSFSSHITLGSEQRIYLMSDYSIRAATRTGSRRSPLLISIPYNGGDAEDRIDICRVQEGGSPTAVEFVNSAGYIYNIGIARLSSTGNFYVGGANFSGLGNVSNAYIANLFGYYEVRLGNSSNSTQPVKFDWFNNLATFGLPVLISSTLTLGTSGTLVGGTNLIEQRNGANAQTWRLYGTYTDSSNYRRLFISSTTGGSFTLGVQGLGTGASGNTLTISSNTLTNTGTATFSNTGYPNGAVTIKQSDGSNVLQGTVSQGIEFKSGWSGNITSGIGLNNDDSLQIRHNSNGTILIASTVVLKPTPGQAAKIQSAGGLAVRNNDDNGDSPITASYVTLSSTDTSSIGNSWTGRIQLVPTTSQYPNIKFHSNGNETFIQKNPDGSMMLGASTLQVRLGDTVTPTSISCGSITSGDLLSTGLVLRNSTTATSLQVYGTYTDASNYRRLYLSSTTAGAFTLSVEGLGTGASGNTLAINTTTITTSPGQTNSQSFGSGNTMVAAGTTLIGTSVNQSYSGNTVGIGYNVNAVGSNSVYIGNNNTAPTPGSVVASTVSIGNAVTSNSSCVVIGASASGSTDSVVLGREASDANGGIAIGRSVVGTGSQPVAIGNNATATVRGVAIGYFANAGTRSVAIGQNTNAFQDSIAIGNTAVTTVAGQLHFGSSAAPISTMSFPGASFSRINLGDATSANPAIKRNGTAINFRLADDSADAPITAATGTFSGKITAPATGQWSTGGIGNGRNGIDFFNGLLTYLDNAGAVLYPSYFTVNGGVPRLKLSSHTLFGWGSATDAGADANVDLILNRDAADTLALRRSTNAQRFNLYGTYTDASNYRRLFISSTTAGAFTIGVEGLGTGASGNTLAINTTTVTTSPGFANSQAFGPGHSMVGTGVTLIGTSINQSYSSSTVGIGYNVNAAGRNSVYIGNSNTAPTPGSVVSQVVSIGDQVTTNTACVAIGSLSSASTNSIAIGYQATAADGGVVIGKSATGTGSQPVAIGNSAYAVSRGVAIGRFTSCGHRSIAIGDTATTTGDGQIHIGSSQSPISTMSFPGASFSRINLGDATSANPAIKRNGTAINFRLADDSADAAITAGAITASGTVSVTNSGTAVATFSVGASTTSLTLRPISSGAKSLQINDFSNNQIAYFGHVGQFVSTADIQGSGFAAVASGTGGIGYSFLARPGHTGRYITLANSSSVEEFGVSPGGNLILSGQLTLGTSGTLVGGTNLIEQRNGANAQTWRLYGTYTDSSNYRRLFISSTTGGSFTLGVQGLGTGASGNTLTILSNSTLSFNVNSAERVTVDTSGNVGIGTSSPASGLVIRRSGATLPAMRLEDGDITVPFTGVNFNPVLGANTVGAWSASASASGGMTLSGFTNNTAAAYPLVLAGYHGSTAPTTPAIQFAGNKSNGLTAEANLASTELIAGFYNGSIVGTPVVTIAANGTITTSGDIVTTPSASITPASNGQLTFEATSNTSITVKYKGSDGVVRSVVLTLT